MAFFDESLFVVVPRLYRALDRALDRRTDGRRARDSGIPARAAVPRVPALGLVDRRRSRRQSATSPPRSRAQTMRHPVRPRAARLRERRRRLAQTVTAARRAEPWTALAARLAARRSRAARDWPRTSRAALPRRALPPALRASSAERLRRDAAAGRRRSAADTAATAPASCWPSSTRSRDALSPIGLERVAYGELQDCAGRSRRSASTRLSLEIRQHSEVQPRPSSAAHDRDAQSVAPGTSRARRRGAGDVPRDRATSSVASAKRRCHRYVISFTHSATDVTRVAATSRARACGDDRPELDVVPLFESADALDELRRRSSIELLARRRRTAPTWRAAATGRR